MTPSRTAVPVEELEALRKPLTRYCYRLLGSAADTEDAVQEALIRAAAKSSQYDPSRARLSTWVHRIATNICIDMLRGAARRALVMDLSPASEGVMGAPLPPERWVEPMPDRRLFGTADPGEIVAERETVRLAFVALLQRVSPRERAALVLRDVLAFSAKESAEILGSTVAAVNSALQRARTTLAAAPAEPAPPLDTDGQAELLARYIAAFEAHDAAAMTALLREDALTSMPPFTWWLRGGEKIAGLTAHSDACAHDRLLPTAVNGAPGFGQYRPDAAGVLRPFAVVVLEPYQGRIARVVTFLGIGERFGEFGLPPVPPR